MGIATGSSRNAHTLLEIAIPSGSPVPTHSNRPAAKTEDLVGPT